MRYGQYIANNRVTLVYGIKTSLFCFVWYGGNARVRRSMSFFDLVLSEFSNMFSTSIKLDPMNARLAAATTVQMAIATFSVGGRSS